MGKEIRLEEKRNDGNKRSREIFPKETVFYFCIFEEHTKMIILKQFDFKKEEEEQRRKREEEQRRTTVDIPTFDRSLKPKDPTFDRQEKIWELAKEKSANNSEDVGVDRPNNERYDHLVRSSNNSGRMHDELARDGSNHVVQHNREMDEGVHMTNRDKYLSPIRKVGTFGNKDHNSNVGTNMNNRGGSVDNYRNRDQRREHCEFVRNYSNQPKCLFINKGIQCELQIPPTGGNSQTDLLPPLSGNIQTNLLMLTPRGNAQTELLMPPPRANVQTDLLATETPHKLGTKEPQLLPRSPLHPLLEENIHLEHEQKRLEESKERNKRKMVTFRKPSTREEETDPEEAHDYEEIPEKEVEHEDDQTTPRSRLHNPIPVRQRKPPKVVLNCTPDRLPRAFLTKTRAQPPFQFQEPPTPTPSPPQITTQWQEEEQELGATGGEGWERQVQDEEHLNEESGEEEWEWESETDEEEQMENNEQLEWDNEEMDWRRRMLSPNAPSVTEQKEELKILIDRELLIVHNLELQINSSATLEGIYIHPDTKCSLLYEPNMATVSANPDHLSDSPQERVRIMQDLYEQILQAKEARVTVLERLAKTENVRRSKRLLLKPKKKYN